MGCIWSHYGGGMERVWNGYGADCLQTRSCYGVPPELTRVKKTPKTTDPEPKQPFLPFLPVSPHCSSSLKLRDGCACGMRGQCIAYTAACKFLYRCCGVDTEEAEGKFSGIMNEGASEKRESRLRAAFSFIYISIVLSAGTYGFRRRPATERYKCLWQAHPHLTADKPHLLPGPIAALPCRRAKGSG